MADKVKILLGLSALSMAASLYQLVTQTAQGNRTFLVMYCALIVLFNRDKAVSQDKIARVVVIITLALLLATNLLVRT